LKFPAGAFYEHFLNRSEVAVSKNSFNGLMERRSTHVVLLVDILGPGKEIVDGFVSTLVTGPVKRCLTFGINAVHINSIHV
jgi:hypothetical protein